MEQSQISLKESPLFLTGNRYVRTHTRLFHFKRRNRTNPGFQSTLDYIREAAQSERQKGDLFERLMLTYFSQDPDYKEQFSEVYLYKDWAALQTGYDANDIGIDLVAKESDGGYCAIQCKCYAENTRISKPHLDSFIAASASELFTSRLIVDTGGEWGPNALRTIDPIPDKLCIIQTLLIFGVN